MKLGLLDEFLILSRGSRLMRTLNEVNYTQPFALT